MLLFPLSRVDSAGASRRNKLLPKNGSQSVRKQMWEPYLSFQSFRISRLGILRGPRNDIFVVVDTTHESPFLKQNFRIFASTVLIQHTLTCEEPLAFAGAKQAYWRSCEHN